ncbi:hypothetical protein PUND_a2026 [Pseudoalteromonas undina]|jgi:hypothetical protein|uniref:DUF2987 domain-containing protein n=1 Tax=Pseudoalteromonas undina TaxID=43660 RepID=A0ABN0NM50_9GAMM|nr:MULTISPECIES: DUF2987 domain-containing protein [Pseudoalteromonas]KAF7766231.1 hypothetical protein PUND_a2026 [Pseudoalteromonas undina]PWS56197.1 DUF2987 domain-containing protein [Pseudoalteromonas sp. meg-B1]TMP56405.1 DUF2987 domain-containing protein [Pseudoalteromonas sp. S1610]TMP76577.1 DUF2987 domain-containing protein [Pseudoalteromonas sp. S1608]
MNKPLLKLVTASFLAVAASSAVAKEFVMSYDGFYDRLKVVNKGDFQYARVNFYISDIGTNEVCSIKNGTILTEKNEYPLNYTDKAQLLLPFDKQLDTDKAVIVVQPKNPVHDCQLKLQIEAKELDGLALSKQSLLVINNELEELLTDLSGFFVSKLMWFLLPEQKGVVVTFKTPKQFDDERITCEKSVCYFEVTDSWEENTTVLADINEVVKVTPWISK